MQLFKRNGPDRTCKINKMVLSSCQSYKSDLLLGFWYIIRYNVVMRMQPYTTDTSDEALAVQLDGFRRMSPNERVIKMCKLSTTLRRMAMDAIRRRHPEFDEHEVRIKFIELTYAKELADSVRDQLRERELA